MRILHVCIYFRNPMFIGLMQAQEQIGTEKRVFYYETRKIGLKHFELPYVDSCSSSIRFLPTPYLRFARLKIMAKEMFELYKNDHCFQCVHAHTLVADGYLALQLKRKWSIPYVVTIRDSDMLFKPYWNLCFYRKILIDILVNASQVIFLSKSSKKLFINLLSNDEKNKLPDVHVIPNGIDDYWHENKYFRDHTLRTIKDTWRIITVGKICNRKNQLVTCEAVEQLRKEGYSLEYEVVGKAENKKMLEKIKKKQFVIIKEFVNKEQLIDEYRKNDIFLLASTSETFGLVYAEAMSQGLPVIFTKGQGFDEQFDDGLVGEAVSSDSIEQIKMAIISIIEKYNLLTRRCTELSDTFSWNIVANSINKVYENAINNNR